MMITIADVLDAPEVEAAVEALEAATFVDGAVTAGAGARAVKSNLQGRSDAPAVKAVTEKVRRTLLANSLFCAAALPVHMGRMLVSRYEKGMHYGWHTDEAFIDGIRTDLSFTLFLSDLTSYDGGALELANSAGTDSIRLPAGHVVVYASGDTHQVTEVTRGQRLAVVGWLQSRIRSSELRELQFDLAVAQADVQDLKPETALAIGGVRQRLLRMWSDVNVQAPD